MLSTVSLLYLIYKLIINYQNRKYFFKKKVRFCKTKKNLLRLVIFFLVHGRSVLPPMFLRHNAILPFIPFSTHGNKCDHNHSYESGARIHSKHFSNQTQSAYFFCSIKGLALNSRRRTITISRRDAYRFQSLTRVSDHCDPTTRIYFIAITHKLSVGHFPRGKRQINLVVGEKKYADQVAISRATNLYKLDVKGTIAGETVL